MIDTAALLANAVEAGEAIVILLADAPQQEYMVSRLTRPEAERQLGIMAASLRDLPPEVRQRLAELDWDGWTLVSRALGGRRREDDEVLWHAVSSLVPATLLWLRVLAREAPELFTFRPPAAP